MDRLLLTADTPTIDAVPVVRCKDCDLHTNEDQGMVYCPAVIGDWVNENWYCADGFKMDEEADT